MRIVWLATATLGLQVQGLDADRLAPVDPVVGWTTTTDPNGW